MLEYCRLLNVELEPFVNFNRDAWVQDDALFDGQRIRNRENQLLDKSLCDLSLRRH